MKDIVLTVLLQAAQVIGLVFVMMMLVDALNVWTRGKLAGILRGGSLWRQYLVASLVGVTPGCIGGFTNVSLYMHGMISFGALVGAMVAVSGDEAFVMLAMFPKTALLLFALLFVIGILVGWLTDRLVKKWNIATCKDCEIQQFHAAQEGLVHYLRDHVWEHIIKRHLGKTALWTVSALLLVELGMRYWHLESLTSHYTILLLFAAALLGLIPESGPHMIFVTLFAGGLIPFSVLFTSAFVQDGHGLLPLLSYSFADSLKLKAFNFSFGLIAGLALFAFGL
jgi:hypothetical protein